MTVKGINKICVIGAGTMGLQIALAAAVHGYQASVYDVSPEVLKKAPDLQRQMLQTMQFGQSRAPDFSIETTMSRIGYTTDIGKAAAGADITSESVPERVEIKRRTHAEFEKYVPKHCIMTTNTSTLLVSDIETALQRPAQFCAMHFHSGLSALVDVMRGRQASEQTLDTAVAFVKSIDMVPMRMRKEKGGYLHNTILITQILSALSLVAEEVATFEEVDRAWMLVTGQDHGPFAVVDAVGINVVYDMLDNPWEANLKNPEKIRALIEPYVKKGELGVKTGKGFYTYPDPAFARPDFLPQEN